MNVSNSFSTSSLVFRSGVLNPIFIGVFVAKCLGFVGVPLLFFKCVAISFTIAVVVVFPFREEVDGDGGVSISMGQREFRR